MEVQWLSLCTSTAGGPGLIPDQGTKILKATLYGQSLKKKKKGSKIHCTFAEKKESRGKGQKVPGIGEVLEF